MADVRMADVGFGLTADSGQMRVEREVETRNL
jgi:hypothetical protein